MTLVRFATGHLKAIFFATAVLCLMGVAALPSFPVAILPDVTFPQLTAIAQAGERPPAMMEVTVTRPMEQAIATVPGVRRIRSKTERGGSEIAITFAWGTDMLTAMQMVNTRLNEARTQLPNEASITVERMTPTVFPILGLSLRSTSLSPSALWSLATYELRPRLTAVPGVARVVVQGGRVPEVAVDVRPQTLNAYHLSLLDVEQALTQSNVIREVGRVDRYYQQNPILVSKQMTRMDQLSDVVVSQHNGVPLFLGQLADIHPAVQDNTTVVTADGSAAVLINIVRQPEASTLNVVDAVKKTVEAARPSLPGGVRIGTFYDQSVLIRAAVASVRDAVVVGAILSVLVLWLFLREWRATLVCATIIPLTVLITFLLMRCYGLTINLMTLGALAVGVGLVVDDAIVVVENVYRHMTLGAAPQTAVEEATAEIAPPMISSTFTTVVVFLPLTFLSGVPGAFFTPLAVTLTIALLVSLALALLVSPTMCAAFLGAPAVHQHMKAVINHYEAILRQGFAHRSMLPAAGLGLLAATVFLATRLGTGFMPEMDEGAFVLDFWMPPGTSLVESDRVLRHIDRILQENPAVASFSRRTGTEMGFFLTEPNKGDYAINLKTSHRKDIDAVMDEVRQRVEKEVAGPEVDFSQVLQDLIGDLSGNAEPVEIKLFGTQAEPLIATARKLAAELKAAKEIGAVDVKNGVIEMGPDLTLQVDDAKAGRVGMTADQIATQAQAALFGDVVTQLVQGDRQVGVRVRYAPAARSDATAIAAVNIRTPAGFTLPLAALGSIETEPGATELHRENQRRMLAVTARLSQRDLGSVMADVQKMMAKFPLPSGITYELGGLYQSQIEAFRNLVAVLLAAILLVFTVMLFQFGTFTAPLVIMLLLPLSLFGVVFGLSITGSTLNVSSFMGGVMLVGIVVKNGILLLDQAQKGERDGLELEEAATRAGRTRLRPILMTTMTALLGLLPLAMGWGAGAQMQQPLAIAVIGGLSLSTLFTLVLAPLLYVALRRRQLKRSGVS